MEVIPLERKLATAGLEHPRLNVLQADETLYTVLAHQPLGRIQISVDSIRQADPAGAVKRTQAFLRLAASLESQPDLLISPEYSVPWDALVEVIQAGIEPEPGKLWVLGCESLTLGSLAAIREQLGDKAIVLDDDLSPVERSTQRYRNPLAYVFKTKAIEDQSEQL